MNERTQSWSNHPLYFFHGRTARRSGGTSLFIRSRKIGAMARPMPTTIPAIHPTTGTAVTALSARSSATLAIAPTRTFGSVVSGNGTSARIPAIESVFESIQEIFDQTSPSRSPACVAFCFHTICVTWFHACAPAWVSNSWPTLPAPRDRARSTWKASSAYVSAPGNGLTNKSGTRSKSRLLGLMSIVNHLWRRTTSR